MISSRPTIGAGARALAEEGDPGATATTGAT